MSSSKAKLIIGLILLGIGIVAALFGTYFYQNALTGIMTTIHLDELVQATSLIPNLQIMALTLVSGVILTIIGAIMAFTYSRD